MLKALSQVLVAMYRNSFVIAVFFQSDMAALLVDNPPTGLQIPLEHLFSADWHMLKYTTYKWSLQGPGINSLE
jgi:hypothetical protein